MRKFLILIVLLISAIRANAVTATIYVQAENAPYLYSWYNYEGQVFQSFGSWPGTLMMETAVILGDTFWKMGISTPDEVTSFNIIFNNGVGGQTLDIVGLSSDRYYTYDGYTGFTDITEYYENVPNAEISQVEIRGDFNGYTDESETSLMTNEDNHVYTMTLDLSNFSTDQYFKLVVNGSIYGDIINKLTIDAPEGWVEKIGDFCLLHHSSTGFMTYRFTAIWKENVDAFDGWTLKIEGKDKVIPHVAQINNGGVLTKYSSLAEAIEAAQDGQIITVVRNCSGNGIKVAQGKYSAGLTVDFAGYTYTVDGTLAGSTGTDTQAFELLKDNNITFKNGTITSTKAKILIQNYSNLTLEGMTLTLNNPDYASAYTLSNNNGNVVIDGTTINANPAGAFAFDVCRYASYPSVNVTVKGKSVINGDVEVSASGSDAKDGFSLTLEEGTLNGNIVLDATAQAAMAATPEKTKVTKKDTFDQDPPEGYKWVSNGDGTSTLCSIYVAKIGTAKYESLYKAIQSSTEGQTVVMIANNDETETSLVDKAITIDLNGKTVTSSQSWLITATADLLITDNSENGGGILNGSTLRAVQVNDGATVTVEDATVKAKQIAFYINDGNLIINDATVSSGAATVILNSGDVTMNSGNLVGGSDVGIVIQYAGNFTMNGGKVTGNGSGIRQQAAVNNGKITINGGEIETKGLAIWPAGHGCELSINDGTITSTNNFAIAMNGSEDYNGGTTVNIKGGTLNGGIYSPNQDAVLNITGGSITGSTGIKVKGGTLNVSGGTITGTGDYKEPAAASSGATNTGAAIYVEDTYSAQGEGDFKPTVNITGGTFVSEHSYAVLYFTDNTTENYPYGGINIDYGIFVSPMEDQTIKQVLPEGLNLKAIKIANGWYTKKIPAEYCVDGIEPDPNPRADAPDTRAQYTVQLDSQYEVIDISEWQLLSEFYQSVNQGDGWVKKWDFSPNKPSVKTLPGVVAKNGHVTEINLSNNGLTGSFPFALLALPNLKSLNLSHNNLSGNISATMSDYIGSNPDMVIILDNVNVSHNQFSGNIGSFAECLPNLVSLDASHNCLEDVNPMISPNVTSLNLSQQIISRVVDLHLSHITMDDVITKVPNILLYDHANQTFTPNINLLCTTPDNTWGITMAYQNGALSIPYVSEQNTYYGESGDILNVAVVKNDGSLEGSTFFITLNYDDGDGNFDGHVNILDLQTTLNYMFDEYKNKPYNFTASNLWKDNVINVQDAVCLVNMLLGSNPSSTPEYALRKVPTQSSDASAIVSVENGYLRINSTVPVSAFDIMVSTSHPAKLLSDLSGMGFTCTFRQDDNNLHLIGYSLSGAEISAGETVICELDDGTVSYAMLADGEANEISVSMNGEFPTGIQSSELNPSSKEVYRIPLGARRAIIIDETGRKTIYKDK